MGVYHPDFNKLLLNPRLQVQGLKPTGSVVASPIAKQWFDGLYLFGGGESVIDLVGLAGSLSQIASPGDSGTVTNTANGRNGTCARVTGTSSSGVNSHKFSADAANGSNGFWHDAFTEFTIVFLTALTGEVSGPKGLFEIGGQNNGLQILYRTAPDTISLVTVANGNPVKELASSKTFATNGAIISGVATLKSGTGKLFFDGKLDSSSGSMDSSVPAHTDYPGFFGHNTQSPIFTYGWYGDGYLLAVSKRAIPDELAIRLSSDPFALVDPLGSVLIPIPSAALGVNIPVFINHYKQQGFM